MQFTVNIPDGSAELHELNDCVAENNVKHPDRQINEQQYVDNIINGWLTNRVLGLFAHHVKGQTVATLEKKLGKLKDIKGK